MRKRKESENSDRFLEFPFPFSNEKDEKSSLSWHLEMYI